jgi:hypothetical protein
MGFFEYYAINADGRDVLYVDLPTRYVFKQNTRQWHRQRGFAIGRMYDVPTAGEKTLSTATPNSYSRSTSISALKNCHRDCYPNFRAACIAAGLLEDFLFRGCVYLADGLCLTEVAWYSCYRWRLGQFPCIVATIREEYV